MADQDEFPGVHELTIDWPDRPDGVEGRVIRWRCRGDVWEGLVSHGVGGKTITEWLPALVLARSESE
jgi:hypothetical protein